MCKPSCWITLIVSVTMLMWPVTHSVILRIRPRDFLLDIALSGMLWKLRIRGLRTAPSFEEFSIELRLLRVITIRKELPAISTRWRRIVPKWRILEEWEMGVGSAGRADDESESVVTWSDLKEWKRIWRRWQPVVRALRVGGRFVRRRMRVQSLRVAVQLGLGDAALTARAYGYAWSIVAIGLAYAYRKFTFVHSPDISIRPRFNDRLLQLDVEAKARILQAEMTIAFALSVLAYVQDKLSELLGKAESVGRTLRNA